MSAKKSSKEEAVPQTITITAEELGWREVKAILKRREAIAKKAVLDARLPEVLKFAGTTFNKEFKTLTAFVNYVSKKPGKKGKKGKRSPRLTDEQKEEIRKLKSDGKTHEQIAKEVGCSVPQVNVTVYAKKK